MIHAYAFTAFPDIQLHSSLHGFLSPLLDLYQKLIFAASEGKAPRVRLPCIASYTTKGVQLFSVCYMDTAGERLPL